MPTKTTWNVVTSADGTVFGVFGAKKKAEADAYAKLLSRPGQTFYADTVSRAKRPAVGTRLR